VQVKHGYASENDQKYILPGDDDSLEEWKKSIIHKFRRFLEVLKVPRNEWNNYTWDFDMDKDENGTNEGEKRGILVWDKKKNIHFNCIAFEEKIRHIKVDSKLIKNHLDREFDDNKKCNCGCGYSERGLLSLPSANKTAFSNHWRNQDKKKDYVSMTEDIYYNKGGREKLLALSDSDKKRDRKQLFGVTGRCYEGIYWVRKEGEDKGKPNRWAAYLNAVSHGETSVSKKQLERLNAMEMHDLLKKPKVFD